MEDRCMSTTKYTYPCISTASTSRRKLSTSPAISTWFREVQEAAKRSISEGKRSGKSKGRYGGGELVRDFIGAELYAEDR
eukprot:1008992-Amorphochlora_amoeboformis.AAC.1